MKRYVTQTTLIFTIALTALLVSTACDASLPEEDIVRAIRKIYARTSQLIEKNKTEVIILNSEAGQDGYEIKRWHLAVDKQNYEAGAYEARVFVLDGDVLKTRVVTQSLSGDWAVVTEYYYYPNGKIAFIFEGNTTYNGYVTKADENGQSQGPFVIEKRSYFSEDGKRIRFLKKAYLKRTGQEVPMDQIQDIDLEKYGPVCLLPFIDLIRDKVKACKR